MRDDTGTARAGAVAGAIFALLARAFVDAGSAFARAARGLVIVDSAVADIAADFALGVRTFTAAAADFGDVVPDLAFTVRGFAVAVLAPAAFAGARPRTLVAVLRFLDVRAELSLVAPLSSSADPNAAIGRAVRTGPRRPGAARPRCGRAPARLAGAGVLSATATGGGALFTAVTSSRT